MIATVQDGAYHTYMLSYASDVTGGMEPETGGAWLTECASLTPDACERGRGVTDCLRCVHPVESKICHAGAP
ncbi:MAG TPA: hypothetical protein VGM88_33750 [Kofleriaceae bacterium]